jgi:glycerol-3-phosphate acyltransferase PlsX
LASRLTIAVDAMSGDHGPSACVPGALTVLREEAALELILVGQPAALEPELAGLSEAERTRVRIVEATQIVGMDEPPREAIRRKKDSSLRRALDLVAAGDADACVSSGNTGALMSTAHFVLGMIEGIERPAIISALPAVGGHTCMLDLGANISATAEQLVQFAIMGAVVAEDLLARPRPRVALLNIGREDIKGNETVKAAHALLQASHLDYVGYVEGNDICAGSVDVIVTDGFTGNVALKAMEGIAHMIAAAVKEEFTSSAARTLGALAAGPALASLKKRLDPRRYNGASMVGLAGVVIKSHGGADAVAFAHAMRVGVLEAGNGVPSHISAQLQRQAA